MNNGTVSRFMNRTELDLWTFLGEQGPATYDEINRWASQRGADRSRDVEQCLTHLAAIGKVSVDAQELYHHE